MKHAAVISGSGLVILCLPYRVQDIFTVRTSCGTIHITMSCWAGLVWYPADCSWLWLPTWSVPFSPWPASPYNRSQVNTVDSFSMPSMGIVCLNHHVSMHWGRGVTKQRREWGRDALIFLCQSQLCCQNSHMQTIKMFKQKSFVQILFFFDFGQGNIMNQGKNWTKAYT